MTFSRRFQLPLMQNVMIGYIEHHCWISVFYLNHKDVELFHKLSFVDEFPS